MANYDVYLRKFRIAVSILAVTITLFVVLLMQLVPKIQKVAQVQKDTSSKSSSLADMERRLETLKKTEEESKEDSSILLKQFFKPISGGSDTESVISDEFAEILQIIRDNKIKTRSIKYEYEDQLQDDNFVKFASNKYHVCRVTADMIGSYAAFENLLRDLYKHEHFLEISKIEIVPYQKNKKILLVNLQLKLYAQRDPNSVVDMPAPQPQAQPAENTQPSPDSSAQNPNNSNQQPEATDF